MADGFPDMGTTQKSIQLPPLLSLHIYRHTPTDQWRSAKGRGTVTRKSDSTAAPTSKENVILLGERRARYLARHRRIEERPVQQRPDQFDGQDRLVPTRHSRTKIATGRFSSRSPACRHSSRPTRSRA